MAHGKSPPANSRKLNRSKFARNRRVWRGFMEQIETLHAGNFRIIQDTETFRFGIDAVLLADFASTKLSPKTSHVVDLCTGNGIVPLLLAEMNR